MKTIEELKAKHEKEIAALYAEEELRAALGDVPGLRHCYTRDYSLYGRKHSVSLGDGFRGEVPPLDDLLALLDRFPAIPMTLCKDGCVWVATREWCDETAETDKGRKREESPICPAWAKLNHGDGYRNDEINWAARVPGFAEPVEFSVALPLQTNIGHMSAERHASKQRGVWYDNRRFHAGSALSVEDSAGVVVAQMSSPARWWCSDTVIGHWRITWEDVHTEDKTTAADILRAVFKV